ncbi:MAG: hypothetical protein P8Y99_10305 [Calditrichaceae bacterium]
MKKQNILKVALSEAKAINDSILKAWDTEFVTIIEFAKKLSQLISDQKNNNDHFKVFDCFSDYQAELVQWLEEKIEQISNSDYPVIYWPESLHSFEKAIASIEDLVNEPFNDSIFLKTSEDSHFKAHKKFLRKIKIIYQKEEDFQLII